MAKHGVEGEELQAYLDGELEPVRQAEVERHLRTCAECAALAADLKRVSQTLQRWQVEPAPARLHAPAVETKPALRWNRWRPGLALAGAAAVVLLLVSISVPDLLRTRSTIETVASRAPEQPQRAADAKTESQPVAEEVAQDRQREALEKPAAPTRPAASREVQGEQYRAQADADAPSEVSEGSGVGGVATGVLGRLEMEKRKEAQSRLASNAALADEVAPLKQRFRDKSAPALPMIARQVTMTVEVKESAAAKREVEETVEEAGGYVAQASSAEAPGWTRRAELVLRVPPEQLSPVLEAIRGLGRVINEQLATQEVTEQFIDLEARLRNTRATEQRLIAVLNERTGKMRDILAVEREIARTRQEIERMEAQRENLLSRVELATINLTLVEEYQAELQPAPIGTATRLRNAFVEGYQSFVATLLGFVFFFARHGLNLLFWAGLFWLMWRAVRRPVLRLVASRQS